MIVQTQHNNYIQNTLLNINLMAKVFGNLKQIVNLARAIRVFGKIELHNIKNILISVPFLISSQNINHRQTFLVNNSMNGIALDEPVRVHQLLRSSLSFDDFGESRHVELKPILFMFTFQYIYQKCGCILTADQLSYL